MQWEDYSQRRAVLMSEDAAAEGQLVVHHVGLLEKCANNSHVNMTTIDSSFTLFAVPAAMWSQHVLPSACTLLEPSRATAEPSNVACSNSEQGPNCFIAPDDLRRVANVFKSQQDAARSTYVCPCFMA